MFYSDTLLSKTGPLARVWLAANLERKLGKKDYITTNLENSIEAIVDQGSAPMALRLSGQLLLGVVRIYSRKAKYLLDDCNEALLKIKMAFRPGNVDLAADQSHTANIQQLMLPDALTELDLLAPLPDPLSLLGNLGMDTQDALIDWGTQSLVSDSIEQGRRRDEGQLLGIEDDDLELDLGDDTLPSVEIGRRARIEDILEDRVDQTSKLLDDDLPLDLGDDTVPMIIDDDAGLGAQDSPRLVDDLGLDLGLDATDALRNITPLVRRQRDSQSPLSELAPEEARELEQTFAFDQDESTILEAQQQQRVKRRRVLPEDRDTELHSADIREMQNDRSSILKPLSFLPRDPMLLALMNMSKNGAFVSDILRNGRAAGWAPQLQDILSIEVIKRSGDLKRKRDSGVSDMYLEDGAQAQLEIPEEGESTIIADQARDVSGLSGGAVGTLDDLPSELGVRAPSLARQQGDNGPGIPTDQIDDTGMGGADFDDTHMPLLHPAETGPISQGTRHVVYLLRDELGPEPAADIDLSESPSQSSRTRQKTVIFQDLLPEATTSRADATKMFFEVLVLATKDAIKVEQVSSESRSRRQDATFELGAPIKLRAKRGLWGSWAEEQAGGQIETQEEEVAS